MNDNPNWLTADDWKWVQDSMPIACCDVLPVRLATDGRTLSHVGLIHRDTPHQGVCWCMVGGRIWRNESLTDAATRQLRETLGPSVRFSIAGDRQPDHVAQYFTSQRPGELLDPRQHAITLVFVVAIEGEVVPGGEAIAFQWFEPTKLPAATLWGFGQDVIVNACLPTPLNP
jgi:ADP-ribose pyrophosphatase YjhB (NUDIX family)